MTGMLAAGTAPAFVRADSLMGLWVPKKKPLYVLGDSSIQTIRLRQHGKSFFSALEGIKSELIGNRVKYYGETLIQLRRDLIIMNGIDLPLEPLPFKPDNR